MPCSQARNLDLLEQCTAPNDLTIPSWVPDWTNVHHYRLFSGRGCYNAAPDKSAAIALSPAGTELIVEGIMLGDVDGLGASYYEHVRASSGGDAMVQTTQSNNPYGDTEGLRRAVWQTLTGNRTPNGRIAPESYQSLLQCPLAFASDCDGCSSRSAPWRGRKAFSHLLSQNQGLMVAGRALGTFFPVIGESDPEVSRDALEKIFRFHRSRRLAVTSQGLLGLVPIAARRGDRVFLLSGCRVPVLVRAAEEGKYQVIGCCYLQGYMEGEAQRGVQDGTLRFESVILR